MQGPVSPEQLQREVDELGSVAAVARAYGMNARTLRDRAAKWGVTSPHAKATKPAQADTDGADDTKVVTLPEHPKRAGLRTPEQVLRDHGLDPDEWDVSSLADNYWKGNDGEGPTELTQSKVVARRRTPAAPVIPARTDKAFRSPPPARIPTAGAPLLIALPSDQHCPHQDEGLEACWLEWCRVNQPAKVLGMGDLMNLSKPHAKHRANLHKRHNDTPDECFQAGHEWWRRTLDACGPDTEAAQLPGNHDLRHQIACLERIPEMYDVTRPGELHPWWDLEYMLGLDKLGVLYVRPQGEYHDAELIVAPGLTVTHGAKAGPYGGAAKDAPRHEGSRATGHDHKQAVTHVVRYRDGEPHRHVLVSVGTMARRDLGYTPDSDVHQGFATVTLHEDGYWNIELARYDDRRRRLVWRDQVYEA